MPRKLNGKLLTPTDHRQWRHVYDSMIEAGKTPDEAGAGATSQVKKTNKVASIAAVTAAYKSGLYTRDQFTASLVKLAAEATEVQALSGKLILTKGNWLILNVPNAIVNGLFAAINVPGAKLPPPHGDYSSYNAHISVMRPKEVEKIGPEKINERGSDFDYQLGPVHTCKPDGWGEMEKVWFVQVLSPQLEGLRTKYGLSATPKGGRYDFHITFAVLPAESQNNRVAKAAAAALMGLDKGTSAFGGANAITQKPKSKGLQISSMSSRGGGVGDAKILPESPKSLQSTNVLTTPPAGGL